jgi:hypothetical protein
MGSGMSSLTCCAVDRWNDCMMGNDPVFLPRTAHILDQMYTGG